MANPLTISPDTLANLIQELAEQRQTSSEAILEELAYRYLDSVPVEFLEDEQVIALAKIMMSQKQQDKLNSLKIYGISPIGRATAALLHLSDNEMFINARKFWKLGGWEAPTE